MSLLNMNPCCNQHHSHSDGLISWVKKCEAPYYDDGTERDRDEGVLCNLFFAPSLAVKMPDQEKMPPIWSHREFAVLIIANFLVFSQTSIRALFSFRLVPCRILCHMSPSHIKKANNQRQATCTDRVHRSKISEKERKKERDIVSG